MDKKQFTNITEQDIKEKGVQALADRPNRKAQYGIGGLEPAQLKAWFDNLATFLKDKINTIHDALRSDDAGAYIGVKLNESSIDNLQALIESIEDGRFADLLKVPSYSDEIITLQEFITLIGGMFRDLDYEKLDRIFDFDLVEGAIGKLYAVIRDKDNRLEDVGIDYGDSIIPNGIVQRTADGSILVPEPNNNSDQSSAAPIGYTNRIVANSRAKGFNIVKNETDKKYEIIITLGDGSKLSQELPYSELQILKIDDITAPDINGDEKHYLEVTYANNISARFEIDELVNLNNFKKTLSEISNALNNKLDKITEAQAVYGTGINGNQSRIPWSGDADENTIALRTWRGTVVTAAPEDAKDAATKKYVDDFKEAVENTVDYTDSLIVALDKRVARLESNVMYVEDDTTAYEKIVPANAYSTALLQKISGATYRQLGENRFDPSTIWSSDVSHTVEPDGSIRFTIGASNYGQAMFYASPPSEGGLYKYKVNIDSFNEGSGIDCSPIADMYMVENEICIEVYTNPSTEEGYDQNVSFNISFMLVRDESESRDTIELKKDTTLIYKPYGYVLKHAKTASIESIGANLISTPYYFSKNGNPITVNGVVYTPNADGSVSLKGIPTADGGANLAMDLAVKTPNTFTVNTTIVGKGNPALLARKRDTSGKDVAWISQNYLTTINTGALAKGEGVARVTIYLFKDVEYDCTIYPMLNYGTEATPYAPYQAEPIDTIEIPEAVQALDGYGKGVNAEYCNYIEFKDGKVLYYKNCKTLVFNGTEDIYAGGNSDGTRAFYEYSFLPRLSLSNSNALSNANTINLISSHFTPATRNQVYKRDVENLICADYEYVRVSSALKTAAEFKAYIAELNAIGTPLTVVYALAEPIVTDITDEFNLDKLIVEGGGKVRFNNDEELPVPSSIQYALRM